MMFRRAAIAIGLLLALLGGALWLGPRFVDWEAQRDRIAALAAQQIGRPVALEGPLRMAFLPHPMVEAEAVVVGGGGPRELAVTARALRLRLDLLSLLRARLEPREVVLVGADIRLPWPPASATAFRPPPWLAGFDAMLQESRIRVGDAVLEGVSARLSAGGVLDAVRAEGGFVWRGFVVRFTAVVGRPGFDGVATLDLTLSTAGASAIARGMLVAEGGFEGRLEAAGSDLSHFLPAPPGPFRATGRLTVVSDLLAADDLVLELAGVPGRGAVALRLAPAPRLDIALAMGRIDLDAWVTAQRAAGIPALPTSLDLSAEAADFRGVMLRRLRGAVFRDRERIALSDVSAVLPGETEVQLDGATAGQRLELALRFAATNLRATLAAFGLPPEGTDPSKLRRAEGRARLVLEGTEIAVPELAATLDGSRVSGAGVLRLDARPSLGLGLTFDRLDLDGLVPEDLDWTGATARLGGFDANLRVAAEHVTWRGAVVEKAALDAAIEGRRAMVRRFTGRVGEADIILSGTVAFEAAPRVSDLSLEVSAAQARGVMELLPGRWPDGTGLAEAPLALRLTGGGPAQAVALRAEGELADMRLEVQGTLDLLQRRGQGTVTLRHPGAQRLIATALGADPPVWLGEGSLSLIATLAVGSAGVAAENFDLVAGALRARGQLALALDGPVPRLAGRVAAERLPLPAVAWRGAEPLDVSALLGWEAEVALQAERVESGALPGLEDLRAALRLSGGRLRIEDLRARLAGGVLEGAVALNAAAAPPTLAAELRLADATISGPLLDLPFDIAAGRVDAALRVSATGHSAAAMATTLTGEAQVVAQDGVLTGLNLGALVAATEREGEVAELEVRKALEDGATAFERLEMAFAIAGGRATLTAARLVGEGAVAATAGGSADLTRGTVDLVVKARPSATEAPDIVLRLTGPAAQPRRLPELAAWARWRAERG